MADTVKKWIDRARYDVDTARAMLESGRNYYVLFCCQQAVEKAIKAVIIAKTAELPPRIHNLPRLIEFAELLVEPSRLDFMAELSAFYVQSRYPDEMESPSGAVSHAEAEVALRKTEDMVAWLLSSLT